MKKLHTARQNGQDYIKLNDPFSFVIPLRKVCMEKDDKLFMDGWPVSMCKTKDVLSAQVYINDKCTKRGASVHCLPGAGNLAMTLADFNSTTLRNDGNYSNLLIIYHGCFQLDDYLQVTVAVNVPEAPDTFVYGGYYPKNIIKGAKQIVSRYKTHTTGNGKELYEFLHNQGIAEVQFTDVLFEESLVGTKPGTTTEIVKKMILAFDGVTLPKRLSSRKRTDTADELGYYPLTPIFYTMTHPSIQKEWTKRFVQSFHVTPARFIGNETKLKERCKKFSITYISPQLEDSVEITINRKLKLQAKCQAAFAKNRYSRISAALRGKELPPRTCSNCSKCVAGAGYSSLERKKGAAARCRRCCFYLNRLQRTITHIGEQMDFT